MIVYTGGTFDGLHVGHIELLVACRRLAGPGGRVVVSLNRDDFVARFKGHQTVYAYPHRRAVLLESRLVDMVVCNVGDEDSRPAIEVVQPNVIAIGDDWAPPRDYLGQLGVTQAWLDQRGLSIEFIPRTTGESTTAVRERTAQGYLSQTRKPGEE